MTNEELIEFLETATPGTPVVVAKDAEGNDFKWVDQATQESFAQDDYDLELDPSDRSLQAIVLWPSD